MNAVTINPVWKTLGKLALAGLITAGSGVLATSSQANAASAAQAATSASIPSNLSAQTGSTYIKTIYKLAANGQIPGLQAIAGKTPISAVHYKWGEPDTGGGEKANHYEFYNFGMGQGAFAFGVNKAGVIYDLRNFGESVDQTVGIKSLTFASVIKTLGMPKEVRFSGTDKIYVYHPSAAYELKFVGPGTAAKGKIAHIDHINVYSAKAAAQ
ncbi:YjgB family protein [Paenibacillus rhizovicinus]|uniref:YjgB family protein n=1 Tax=Paenibacillus rhizovicinus TaxID=2704463 RepID=A0A6C0P1Y3_9BACL|nr:YjgB family protein [Paenibacillus rhizovicinus]QHW32504.1 YjgB family protein [Paenibacillus rhizovicinus]